MHLYSHLVIAQALQPICQPRELDEYYWGAVAPDIRYLAGMRRRATHLPPEAVRAWTGQWPTLRDFTLGYLVHILADERDGAGALYARIPCGAVRRRLPRQLAAVLLEIAYAERVRLDVRISGRTNAILSELGVQEADVALYAEAASRYAGQPSFFMAMTMLVEAYSPGPLSSRFAPPQGGGKGGAEGDKAQVPAFRQARLERYLRMARWLESHPRLKKAIIERVDVSEVTQRIVADLQKQIGVNI